MKLYNLRDLMVDQLRELYNAENQLLEFLPTVINHANDENLRRSFQVHLQDTKIQKDNLNKIFEQIKEEPGGRFSTIMKSIQDDVVEFLENAKTPEVKDAGLIALVQKSEHYEIACHGTLREYAKELNEPEVEKLLSDFLYIEKDTDRALSSIAESEINQKAKKEDKPAIRRTFTFTTRETRRHGNSPE